MIVKMQALIAVIVSVLGGLNYYGLRVNVLSTFVQIICLLLQVVFIFISFMTMIKYRGKRFSPNYEYNGVKNFSFGFALTIIAFLGNGSILVVFILQTLGIIKSI